MDNKQFPEQEDQEFFPEYPLMPEEKIGFPLDEFLPEDPVEEEIPQDTVPHDLLSHPELGEEITADEHAMAWHGMTHPSEPEPPFDLSILDDPEFDEPQPEPEVQLQETAEEEFLPEEPPFRDEEFRETFGDGEDFSEMFNAPVEETPIPTHDRPTRKGRPKRKKGEGFFGIPNLITTCVWLAIILAIGVTLGRMLWVCAADVLAFGKEDKVVTVTIYQSDTIEDITDKLYDAGLIEYPGLFKLYADLAVDEGEIKPGVWDLNTRYDYHALVSVMSVSSTYEEVEVVIPEGYTCAQIFELLEESKVCTAVDLAAWAATGELNEYWFLEGVERGTENCLEGYLFPDTYRFYKNDSARNVLQRMLNNFEIKFDDEMRAQIDTLNANVTEGTFTVQDVVIVASLIEKETAGNDESPMIASVIYNRLFDWGDTPAYLNIDAAIVYALGGKTDLTAEDLQVDSPYNTYTNIGLTPGPISNPGLASLKAALDPAESDYYFYVLDPSVGSHKFTTTYDEHQAVIASLE